MSTDEYMNLHLANTDEYIDDNCTGSLGEVLIRSNNVLYIRCEIIYFFYILVCSIVYIRSKIQGVC